jgi:hypothetical protein
MFYCSIGVPYVQTVLVLLFVMVLDLRYSIVAPPPSAPLSTSPSTPSHRPPPALSSESALLSEPRLVIPGTPFKRKCRENAGDVSFRPLRNCTAPHSKQQETRPDEGSPLFLLPLWRTVLTP